MGEPFLEFREFGNNLCLRRKSCLPRVCWNIGNGFELSRRHGFHSGHRVFDSDGLISSTSETSERKLVRFGMWLAILDGLRPNDRTEHAGQPIFFKPCFGKKLTV